MPLALSVTSVLATSSLRPIFTRSPRPPSTESLIQRLTNASSHRSSVKHRCMTSWSMLPQTSAGVKSLAARTREDRMGLRLHCGAFERAVAVSSRSGCRIIMFDWEVMDMFRRAFPCDFEKVPRTLNMSSTRVMSRSKKWKELITNQSECLLGTNHHIETHPRVLLLVGPEQRRTGNTMSTQYLNTKQKYPLSAIGDLRFLPLQILRRSAYMDLGYIEGSLPRKNNYLKH